MSVGSSSTVAACSDFDKLWSSLECFPGATLREQKFKFLLFLHVKTVNCSIFLKVSKFIWSPSKNAS